MAEELSVRLSLNEASWELTLSAESDAIGEPDPLTIPLPFEPNDIPLVERALDLNGTEDVKRRFEPDQILRLKSLRVLPEEAGAGPILTGPQLARERLRDLVCGWLTQLLLDPLRDRIDKHFSALAAIAPGDRSPTLYLSLRLHPKQDALLLRLPWELLHQHRLTYGNVQVGRYLRYEARPGSSDPAQSLTVLVVQSDPELPESRYLHLKECERIQQGIKESEYRNKLSVVSVQPPTYEALASALRSHRRMPLIVHFAGHGDFGWNCPDCGRLTSSATGNPCGKDVCALQRDDLTPSGFLAFAARAANSKEPHWVGIKGLRDALMDFDVRLLVLNACKTAAARGGEDVFNGMAQQLMDVVPAVVATPHPLDTAAAEIFAKNLYRALGDGLSLGRSLGRVRREMAQDYPDEWYRPVLYRRHRRDDGGRLLDLTEGHGASFVGNPTGVASGGEREPQSPVEAPVSGRPVVTPAGVAVGAPKHWSRQAFVDPFLDGPGEGPEMMALTGGRFAMGEDGYKADERPVHEVQIDDFAIAVTPVTRAQYRAFLGTEGSSGYPTAGLDHRSGRANMPMVEVYRDDAMPVVEVSWEDADRYCQWLSTRTGRVYRLPMEKEWEYACRADHKTPWSFGADPAALARYGWYADNADGKGPRPVRQREPNPWGLHDMHGNVLEWCRDWYAPSYASRIAPIAAQGTADHGPNRILRGGSFRSSDRDCRCASRDGGRPQGRGATIGFRVARDR